MVTADHNPRLGRGHNDTPAAPRVRWGDRAGVGISKILAESVYGRRQRLACYVSKSRGKRQIRHFSSAFILMHTVSFIIYITV